MVSRTIIFFAVLLGFAGAARAQDLNYFRTVLASGNVEAKRTVLMQIRELKTEEASQIAVQGLNDKNEIVRATAASSVVFLAPAQGVSSLVPLLNDKAPFVRTEAAYALGRIGDASAVRPLIATLQNDKAKEVRAAAAVSLGKIGDAAAINDLASVFSKQPSEDNEFIRRSAARSIGQIAEISRQRTQQFDFASSAAAVPLLIKALNNSKETDDTRREAASTLGWIGDPAASSVLRSHLNSPDYYLVDICKAALARIESRK